MDRMAAADIAISAGSACAYGARKPSYVALAHGLSYEQAADKIAWLLAEARRLGFTGVALKDRQNDAGAGEIGGPPPSPPRPPSASLKSSSPSFKAFSEMV